MSLPEGSCGPVAGGVEGRAEAGPKRAPERVRLPRRPLHGVMLVDKPLGWTSNDVLQKVKGMLRAEKAGHTGTLDPLATGLLPLCFGAATKFAQANLDADKRYQATLTLGMRTTSGDGEGEVIDERAVEFDRAALQAALAGFVGAQDQLPPMLSALKHKGRALYDYARAGVEVERVPRRVHIHALELVGWDNPSLVIEIHCSKGTYVRTLAEDIGRALGCGATLAALRRTGSGPLTLAGAITLEALAAAGEAERDARLLHSDCLLADWPEVLLDADDAGRFLTGLRRRLQRADAAAVRVYAASPRAFLGTAHITAGELIPDRLLAPTEVRPS